MLSQAQSVAIYGGSACLAYIETSGYEKENKLLLAMPFILLALLTLATTMSPKVRITTTLSFLVLALATYVQSSQRTTAPAPGFLLTVANLFYYLSFRELVRTTSKYVIIFTILVSFGGFFHILQDLVVAIPWLVLILTMLIISHVLLISTSASLCHYGMHGDYDASQASAVRLVGTILSWLSTFLFFINSFQTHTKTLYTISRVLLYTANGLLYIANERAF